MSRETTRSELGQMIGSRRFDVARYYHVTIGRTTGTTETYQNLANNSDAVGTSLRIFHKSWRSLSLGAKLRPFYTSNEERCLTSIIDNLSAWKSYRWEKAFLPLFSLLFLSFSCWRDACTHESFKFCSLRVMEHSRHGNTRASLPTETYLSTR